MTRATKQQPTTGDPWAGLAADLANVRRDLANIYRDAQSIAEFGPMVGRSPVKRQLIKRKQADTAATLGTELHRWELLCRNESARLELQARP